MRLAAAFLILAIEAAAPARKIYDAQERGNLLNIALGASVVSRTGELTLDQSALRAIDGDPENGWISPPEDWRQTIVFALPALTHIEKIGVKTPRAPLFHVSAMQVDSSADGTTFSPLATLKIASVDDPQLFPVQPRDLVYLRVTILETAGGHYARLDSLQAHGKFTQPIAQKPIDGCWSVNGFPASFATDRGRTTGSIGGDHPVSFDGATDGTVYRFIWTSGPDYGFGAIDTAPDGKHLSGLRWYVEPIAFSAAESWFGERTKCTPATQRPSDPAANFLQRTRRLPLYGLHFDANGSLNETESAATLDKLAGLPRDKRYRLVSREFRMDTPAANRQRSQQRLDSLRTALQKRGVDPARFDWQAIGSESPARPIETEIQRVLYGVIELHSL